MAIKKTVSNEERRARLTERTRADILSVALEEFAEKGLSGARVDEIAERTQTSKRMIYYHFGSKEELYRAVLELSYGEIRQLETQVDISTLPPEQALRHICEVTFDYHASHPEFVRIIMNENILNGEYIGSIDSIRERNEVILRNLGLVIQRGVKSGVFRTGIDPIDLHMSISALSFHVVSNRHTFSKIFSIDMQSPEFLDKRKAVVCETILGWVRAQ